MTKGHKELIGNFFLSKFQLLFLKLQLEGQLGKRL